MRKILITTGIFFPDIGGPASAARIVAKALSLDADVTVLTYSSRFSNQTDKKEKYRIVRVWRKVPKPMRQIIYLIKLFFLAGKSDVIFSLSVFGAGFPAAIVSRVRGKRLVVRIVGDSVWEKAMVSGKTSLLIDDYQLQKKTGWYGMLHRIQVWVTKSASSVIVPSEYLSGIVEGWGVDFEKIEVINNSTDLVESGIGKEEARKKIGIPGSIILSVGRLVPWKGFRMLIKMMPKLLEMNAFTRLVIVGSGPEKKILSSYIKNLHLEKKVILVPSVSPDDLVTYFRASDLFILNTGYEGFSHLMLEAMHLGVPVITTAVGGNREIIKQGVNGFMVRFNDEFNIMEGIKTVRGNPEMREQFIANGRGTARHYTVERMMKGIRKVILK